MQLGRMYEQFRETGTEIIVILGENLEKSRAYAEGIDLPFPILSDPDRAI